MTQRQRLQAITSYVQTYGELSVARACELFDASPATIRRDFGLLMEEGAVVRTRGGITGRDDGLPDDPAAHPAWLRETLHSEEKRKIAERAAALVQDGDAVMIDGGTTTYYLAGYLANRPVRIITNSVLVAHQIDLERRTRSGAEVMVTGGLIYPEAGMLVGPQAIKNIREYHARWAFLSAGGIDAAGATNSSELVVETQRTIMEQCESRIILADHSKLGKKSLCRLCGVAEITALITGADPQQKELVTTWQNRGVEVLEIGL